MTSLRISLLQALTLVAGNLGGSRFAASFKPIPIPVSVANLLGRGFITEQEVWAAVDAFIADPNVRPHRFSSGHSLDVAGVVTGHRAIVAILADPNLTDTFRRELVRTTVILAMPTAASP